MKRKRLFILLALMGIIGALTAGCQAATGANPVATTSNATAQRGDLKIEITGTGNLAYSKTADLAFEMAGTVDEVLVQAGDSVTEGQEVARLDTSAWEDQLTALERQLTTAQRNLKTAEDKVTTVERQVTTTERQVTTAERQVPVKERGLLQAQINLQNAQTALDKALDTYTGPDVETAQAEVDKAEAYLQYAIDRGAEPSADPTVWGNVVQRAQASLDAAQKTLDALLTSSDSDDVAIKRMQLQIAQGGVQDARDAIDNAKVAIDDANLEVNDAKAAVDNANLAKQDAEQSVTDAQKALDEANKTSPVIKSPFAGFVTQVNVKGGDEIKKGTIAMQIADPAKFQAEIMVSEIDIFKVKQGGDATVQVDAMSGLSFPAKVTLVSPTATIQQGVVNYVVTVEVQSLRPAQSGQTGSSQSAQGSQSGQNRAGQLSAAPSAMQLKQGLSTTVSVLVENKANVLLIPARAITRQGRDTTVQVLKADGTSGTRIIKTGSTDGRNTEVTEGLSEGEKLVITQTTSTSTSTQRQGGGMPFGIMR